MYQAEDKIGDYHLVKFLGRGQYGEVWLAEKQLQFSTRRVRHALKFLFKQGDEAIDLKSVESEIDTWIEASGHPNVMSVIDMLVHDERMIIVSEYAEGGSLKNWLQHNDRRAPSAQSALEMMIGILRGIEHLHSRSVVHRDLKPDNILLQGNFPRITDFGISRIVSESTMSTNAVGSPAYMSPESFDGDKRSQADLWAAGVILYEMLTGAYPFSSETIYGLFEAIRNQPVNPLPEEIPPAISTVVYKALEKDRIERYQTATEMRQAIEQAIYELKVSSSQETVESKETLELPHPPTSEVTESNETREQYQPPISAETILLAAQSSTGEGNALNSVPTVISSRTQHIEADRTDGKYIEETISWHVPETIVSGSTPVADKTPPRKTSSWIFAGLASGMLGLVLFGGAGLVALNHFSSKPANDVEKPAGNLAVVPKNSPSATPKITLPEGMAYVPGGTFMMGRDDGVSDAEKPAHQVTIKPFFMDIYELTNSGFKAKNTLANVAPYSETEKNIPVVGITWNMALEFCQASGKRLPTEEEWEFAARGTDGFLYPWGNIWDETKANVNGKKLAAAGSFQDASPFGIHDLSGNVWEWTSSDFKAYPGGALPAVFAGKTNLKTIRGGSFEATKDYATATYRIGLATFSASDYSRTGFRCVKNAN